MSHVKRLSRGTKDDYWGVVQDCLTDLFQVPPVDAAALCNDRRAEVEFAPKAVRSNVFYHREPFDVAENLAARRGVGAGAPTLSDPAVSQGYQRLLARHGLA
jgi:hypothetical protein